MQGLSLRDAVFGDMSAAYLLLEDLCVGGALRGAQVEGPVSRVCEFLQLVVPVALLGSLYGPLLFGWALMGSRGWLTPTINGALLGRPPYTKGDEELSQMVARPVSILMVQWKSHNGC